MKIVPEVPWPTAGQCERMGFVCCQQDGCSVFVNPELVPSGFCQRHQKRPRARVERSPAELRIAPLPDGYERRERRRGEERAV